MTARARRKSPAPRKRRKAFESFKGAPAILEGFVDFAFEASVVAARGADGAFAAYDPPENEHENHILRRSIVPGRLTAAQVDEAKAIAKKIADALGLCRRAGGGTVRRKDGALLVNEIAPRVHNSGHWTIEACACQPVRAAYPRRRRLAAGRSGAPCRRGDGKHHRRRSRWLGKTLAAKRAARCISTARARPARAARWATSRASQPRAADRARLIQRIA